MVCKTFDLALSTSKKRNYLSIHCRDTVQQTQFNCSRSLLLKTFLNVLKNDVVYVNWTLIQVRVKSDLYYAYVQNGLKSGSAFVLDRLLFNIVYAFNFTCLYLSTLAKYLNQTGSRQAGIALTHKLTLAIIDLVRRFQQKTPTVSAKDIRTKNKIRQPQEKTTFATNRQNGNADMSSIGLHVI